MLQAIINARDAGSTFAKMRSYDIDLGLVANQAHPRRLVSVDATQARTQIAAAQMSVCPSPFHSGIPGTEHLVSGHVVVEQKWGRKVEAPRLLQHSHIGYAAAGPLPPQSPLQQLPKHCG